MACSLLFYILNTWEHRVFVYKSNISTMSKLTWKVHYSPKLKKDFETYYLSLYGLHAMRVPQCLIQVKIITQPYVFCQNFTDN